MKRVNFKTGEAICLRKALVNNLAEEKRARLHVQKLQKGLAIRFKEIEREKAALKKFLAKLQETTGYFSQSEIW